MADENSVTGDTSTVGVLVEFSGRYDQATSCPLAGYAPAHALYLCRRVTGGTLMVVMKCVLHSGGPTSLRYAPLSPSTLGTVRRDVYRDLELHQGTEPCFRWPQRIECAVLDEGGSCPAR